MILQGEDEEARLAHLALQNHNMLPKDYLGLSMRERGFLHASDRVKDEANREMIEQQEKRIRRFR